MGLTVEEAKKLVELKRKRIDAEKEEKERAEMRENYAELEKCNELLFDIMELIIIGRAIHERFPEFPDQPRDKQDRKKYMFKSDGWEHEFGFVEGANGLELGWINGGCRGNWDVHCDGKEFFYTLWQQKERLNHQNLKTSEYVRFRRDFKIFKVKFTEWFINEFMAQ